MGALLTCTMAIRTYTIRRVENKLLNAKLEIGGDSNLHMSKMSSLIKELEYLQHPVAVIAWSILLQRLPG